MKRLIVLLVSAVQVILLQSAGTVAAPPTAVGPMPNERQMEWYHHEVEIFFHFNMNTFTGKERDSGTASPALFNPELLDCEQWVRTVKNAGFTCAILTAKHHDGFCLWPSAYTDYDIAASPWRNGSGDVVREFTDACRKYGVKPGLYLSPWDLHEPSYGTSAYNTFYANQLSELLKNYGTIWEIWWDGAGDQMKFDFRRWTDTVLTLQPSCFIFGAKKASPYLDGRWVGNEDGIAGDPCWATIDRAMIDVENVAVLSSGQVNGDAFVPAECDVSIRPGWYFHPGENALVKTVSTLWNDIYFGSVGRNCVLLLNLPPDTRGLVHPTDSIRLDSLGGWVRGTFTSNLAANATVSSLHPRGAPYEPENMLDTLEDTYYSAADGFSSDTLTFDLGILKTFDCVMLQERIELGHRISRWSLDYSKDGTSWSGIAAASGKQCIGYKRLVKFNTVSARRVRLRITQGKACPVIHTFGLFRSTFMNKPVVGVSTTPFVAPPGGNGADSKPVEPFSASRICVGIYDLRGRQLVRYPVSGTNTGHRSLPGTGVFVVRYETATGRRIGLAVGKTAGLDNR